MLCEFLFPQSVNKILSQTSWPFKCILYTCFAFMCVHMYSFNFTIGPAMASATRLFLKLKAKSNSALCVLTGTNNGLFRRRLAWHAWLNSSWIRRWRPVAHRSAYALYLFEHGSRGFGAVAKRPAVVGQCRPLGAAALFLLRQRKVVDQAPSIYLSPVLIRSFKRLFCKVAGYFCCVGWVSLSSCTV